MKRELTFRTVVWTAFAGFALLSLAAGVKAIQGDKKIRMYDDCDPATFNAVLGDGACVGNGKTTFTDFIGELQATQDAKAWRNQPSKMQVVIGRPSAIENRGGETHTFTPVANFGGGFVNELNGISGNPVPAPECLNFGAIVFIPAGGSEEGPTAGLSAGTYKFQCCIHPWMRTVLEVKDDSAKNNSSNSTSDPLCGNVDKINEHLAERAKR